MGELDVIIPEIPSITLYDRKTKQKYEVDLFVPTAVGLIFLEESEKVEKIFQKKVDKDTLKLIFKIFEMILKPQFSFMDLSWIERNIDLNTSLLILIKIATPIFDYIKILGAIPTRRIETATPEKKPEVTTQ